VRARGPYPSSRLQSSSPLPFPIATKMPFFCSASVSAGAYVYAHTLAHSFSSLPSQRLSSVRARALFCRRNSSCSGRERRSRATGRGRARTFPNSPRPFTSHSFRQKRRSRRRRRRIGPHSPLHLRQRHRILPWKRERRKTRGMKGLDDGGDADVSAVVVDGGGDDPAPSTVVVVFGGS